MLNCSKGKNRRIMGACGALRGYGRLVALARERREAGLGRDEAVVGAVEACIREGVLADYLLAHKSEVVDMLFTIQDEERAMRVHRKAIEREAHERGLAQGRAEERRSLVAALVGAGVADAERIAEAIGVSPDELESIAAG